MLLLKVSTCRTGAMRLAVVVASKVNSPQSFHGQGRSTFFVRRPTKRHKEMEARYDCGLVKQDRALLWWSRNRLRSYRCNSFPNPPEINVATLVKT